MNRTLYLTKKGLRYRRSKYQRQNVAGVAAWILLLFFMIFWVVFSGSGEKHRGLAGRRGPETTTVKG